MNMNAIPNWRVVLRYAWSVRLMLLAAVLSGAEIAMPFLEGIIPVPRGGFAALSAVLTIAAFIARFIAQDVKGIRDE